LTLCEDAEVFLSGDNLSYALRQRSGEV
jgi:hypothetical protein